LEITLTFAFILINAFFAFAEQSVISSKRGNLEKMEEENVADAGLALAIIERPLPILSALQIGMNFTALMNGVMAGTAIAPSLALQIRAQFPPFPYIDELSLFCVAASVLYLTLVVGEYIPKLISINHPEKFLCYLASPLERLAKLLYFPVKFLESSSVAALHFWGFDVQTAKTVTEDEVMDLIEQGTEDGTFEKTEQDMVDNIFHLSDQNAYALMTPRTQLVWLDLSDSLEQNLKIIKENPDTVFPVARENLDEFVGMLYAKDLLEMALDHAEINLEKCIHTPVFIPKSMHSFKVLEQFRESGIHEAVVLDEFGGVVGMITMRDIINEVVGDAPLVDEEQQPVIVKRDDRTWLIDGLLDIDDFKEHFHINEMPGEERDHYQTLGGFITSYLNYIPTIAESFVWNGLRFEIIVMDRARVDKILVTRLPKEEAIQIKSAKTNSRTMAS